MTDGVCRVLESSIRFIVRLSRARITLKPSCPSSPHFQVRILGLVTEDRRSHFGMDSRTAFDVKKLRLEDMEGLSVGMA